MPLLDVALAFALTMLAVSTAVSQIVHLLQKLASMRAKCFQKMVTQYVHHDLEPVVNRELCRVQDKVSKEAADAITHALSDLKERSLLLVEVDSTGKDHELGLSEQVKRWSELSTEELVEFVKRSELGHQLLRQLGDGAERVFAELAKTWESVGNRYSKSFRAESRLWATAVAALLALVLNIDSIFVLSSFYKNSDLRETVIAQSDQVVHGYEDLVEKLNKESKESISRAELEAAVGDAKQSTKVLSSLGLPVGYEYFPHAAISNPNSAAFTARDNARGWLSWILGIVLTALLAGVGAPFWYDAVAGVARVSRRTKQASP